MEWVDPQLSLILGDDAAVLAAGNEVDREETVRTVLLAHVRGLDREALERLATEALLRLHQTARCPAASFTAEVTAPNNTSSFGAVSTPGHKNIRLWSRTPSEAGVSPMTAANLANLPTRSPGIDGPYWSISGGIPLKKEGTQTFTPHVGAASKSAERSLGSTAFNIDHDNSGQGADGTPTLAPQSAAAPESFWASARIVSQVSVFRDAAGFETINNYAFLDEIGKGAHGTVYLAQDLFEPRLVAIKMIRRQRFRRACDSSYGNGSILADNGQNSSTHTEIREPVSPPPFPDPVHREIAIMKNIKSAHVVRLLEAIDDDQSDYVYLVMPYMEKGPVLRKTSDGFAYHPLEERTALGFLKQIGRGIQFLHSQNIVHGDIKPDNLLLDADESVHIADFGVSELYGASAVVDDEVGEGSALLLQQQPAFAVGTPVFFAPELFSRGSFHLIRGTTHATRGKAADMWAVGMTFYLMIFGHLPFPDLDPRGKDFHDSFSHRIVDVDIPIPDTVSEVTQRLLRGLLCRSPATRMTADELRGEAKSSAFRAVRSAMSMSPEQTSPRTTRVPLVEVTEQQIHSAFTGRRFPRNIGRAALATGLASECPSPATGPASYFATSRSPYHGSLHTPTPSEVPGAGQSLTLATFSVSLASQLAPKLLERTPVPEQKLSFVPFAPMPPEMGDSPFSGPPPIRRTRSSTSIGGQ